MSRKKKTNPKKKKGKPAKKRVSFSVDKFTDDINARSVKTYIERILQSRTKLPETFNQSVIGWAEDTTISMGIDTFIYYKGFLKEKINIRPVVRKYDKRKKPYYVTENGKRTTKIEWLKWITYKGEFSGSYKKQISAAKKSLIISNGEIAQLRKNNLVFFQLAIKKLIKIYYDRVVTELGLDSPFMIFKYYLHPESFFNVIILPPIYTNEEEYMKPIEREILTELFNKLKK